MAALGTFVDELRALDSTEFGRDDAGNVRVETGVLGVLSDVVATPAAAAAVTASTGIEPVDGDGNGYPDDPAQIQAIYETALRQQVPRPLVDELIRIYSYDVDFQRKVQPGDSFELLYPGEDETGGDAKPEVLFAALTVGGETKRYYRFVTPDDGVVDYYDETGKSAKKFLVRKPLGDGVMRSGFGFLQSLEVASREQSDPISGELVRTIREINLGMSTEDALARIFGPPLVEMRETYAQDQGERAFDHSRFEQLLQKHVDAAGMVHALRRRRLAACWRHRSLQSDAAASPPRPPTAPRAGSRVAVRCRSCGRRSPSVRGARHSGIRARAGDRRPGTGAEPTMSEDLNNEIVRRWRNGTSQRAIAEARESSRVSCMVCFLPGLPKDLAPHARLSVAGSAGPSPDSGTECRPLPTVRR